MSTMNEHREEDDEGDDVEVFFVLELRKRQQ
jgi:hypothetical protein